MSLFLYRENSRNLFWYAWLNPDTHDTNKTTTRIPTDEREVHWGNIGAAGAPSRRCHLFNWPRCAMFKQYLLHAKTGTFIFAVDPAFGIFPRHWRSTTIVTTSLFPRCSPFQPFIGRNHAGGSCFLIIETSISQVEHGTLNVYWPFIVRQIKGKKGKLLSTRGWK